MIELPVTSDRDMIIDANGVTVATTHASAVDGGGIDRYIAAVERADEIVAALNATFDLESLRQAVKAYVGRPEDEPFILVQASAAAVIELACKTLGQKDGEA